VKSVKIVGSREMDDYGTFTMDVIRQHEESYVGKPYAVRVYLPLTFGRRNG